MTGARTAREFELIERVFQRGSHRDDVILGIGDDAAITRLSSGVELVTATDTLVCGTHFVPEAPASSVGHRVLAANLSDLAAMGAEPLWASLSISLPAPDMAWLESFAQGLFSLADQFAVELIGGDTVRGALAATVTMQGSLPSGQAVRRAGAGEGDLVFVTGYPGDAVAGRLMLAGELVAEVAAGETRAAEESLHQRFLYPQPRIAMGMRLRSVASAMIDLSDGLQSDLAHLLAAAGLGAVVHLEELPVSDALRRVSDISRARQFALCGGDDYELCFTAPADQASHIHEIGAELHCPVFQIGVVDASNRLNFCLDGKPVVVPDSGFRHFE
jgi:thiamine-monophosphate kinase